MNDFKEIYEALDKVKISIIMQVNLEKYPGAREDSINKFHRAVESFNNQIYKNCELIIVADGCNKTHQLYNRSHKENANIKFVYYDRSNTPKMYEEMEEGTYYRGAARQLGIAASTGSLITYMDSDDYIMPNHTMSALLEYNAEPEKTWWINGSWYDNSRVTGTEKNLTGIIDPNTIESVELAGLPETWKPMQFAKGRQIMAPWLFMHVSNISNKWQDVISSSISEDIFFIKEVQGRYKNGALYSQPTYVRCHMNGVWDV
jgi:hypothetical protein